MVYHDKYRTRFLEHDHFVFGDMIKYANTCYGHYDVRLMSPSHRPIFLYLSFTRCWKIRLSLALPKLPKSEVPNFCNVWLFYCSFFFQLWFLSPQLRLSSPTGHASLFATHRKAISVTKLVTLQSIAIRKDHLIMQNARNVERWDIMRVIARKVLTPLHPNA